MQVRIVKYAACLLVVGALTVCGMVLFGYMNPLKSSATSVSAQNTQEASQTVSTKQVDALADLVDALNATIQASAVSTSVSVIDIASGKQYDAGLDVDFRAASTTKVLTAAAFMHQVEQGNATLATQINGASAQTMLQSMLQQSNNAAWKAFNDYLGQENLEAYARSIGLSSFAVTDNTIRAHDQAKLLTKLYDNELTSTTHTQMILSFMQNTDNERLIPAALPTGATVYHKYGYLEGELHDSAIITYAGHTFVLVIYTNNQQATIDDYESRRELIHLLTSDVLSEYGTAKS